MKVGRRARGAEPRVQEKVRRSWAADFREDGLEHPLTRWGKKGFFPKQCPVIYGEDHRVGPRPHTMYKINLKWVQDLSGRDKTRKLLGENIGISLYDFVLNNVFLLTTKEKINWAPSKL